MNNQPERNNEMRANPTPATYEPDTPKTPEEEAVVAAFGFDKAPNGLEQLAVATTRAAAAWRKLREALGALERRSRS